MRETRTRPEGVPDIFGENLERQMLVYRDYLGGGGGGVGVVFERPVTGGKA